MNIVLYSLSGSDAYCKIDNLNYDNNQVIVSLIAVGNDLDPHRAVLEWTCKDGYSFKDFPEASLDIDSLSVKKGTLRFPLRRAVGGSLIVFKFGPQFEELSLDQNLEPVTAKKLSGAVLLEEEQESIAPLKSSRLKQASSVPNGLSNHYHHLDLRQKKGGLDKESSHQSLSSAVNQGSSVRTPSPSYEWQAIQQQAQRNSRGEHNNMFNSPFGPNIGFGVSPLQENATPRGREIVNVNGSLTMQQRLQMYEAGLNPDLNNMFATPISNATATTLLGGGVVPELMNPGLINPLNQTGIPAAPPGSSPEQTLAYYNLLLQNNAMTVAAIQNAMQLNINHVATSPGLTPINLGNDQMRGVNLNMGKGGGKGGRKSKGSGKGGRNSDGSKKGSQDFELKGSGKKGKDRSLVAGPTSALMEEFKQRKRKIRLSEIAPHIIEFALDQHGSRYIQQELETAADEEKQALFLAIVTISNKLTSDVFGNYVIQKFFEHGNAQQRKLLAEQLVGEVQTLCFQLYGCRVVQKALEYVSIEQQVLLVGELKNVVLACVEDQNGNHVIQKCLERMPSDKVQFIIDAFASEVRRMATHCYGCRVLQRIIEYCAPEQVGQIYDEIHESNLSVFIHDQYGNYVVQYMVAFGRPVDRDRVFDLVCSNLTTMSCHKFASNIVEKCLSEATELDIMKFLDAVLGKLQKPRSSTNGTAQEQCPLLTMMKDKFGNYVVQSIMNRAPEGEQKDALFGKLKDSLPLLQTLPYGKHIMYALREGGFMSEDELTQCLNRAATANGGHLNHYHDGSLGGHHLGSGSSNQQPILTSNQLQHLLDTGGGNFPGSNIVVSAN